MRAHLPLRLCVLVPAVAILLAGCGSPPGAAGHVLRVLAAENFWGSIAGQLGGSKASVESIIADPVSDPHSYEPSAADARSLATAQLVILNGLGYDPWAPKLLAANPVPGRRALTVGRLLGLARGDNPHRWYSPADVDAVANAITAEYKRLDPLDAPYFDARRASFQTRALARYHHDVAAISSRYAGVAVGASESIFALLAPALRLRLITPDTFMKAISEGTEISAGDAVTARNQISAHQVKVWIYNSQNASPDIQRLNALARAQRIPIATVTETLSPASASFEDWQAIQLEGIARALHQATGR